MAQGTSGFTINATQNVYHHNHLHVPEGLKRTHEDRKDKLSIDPSGKIQMESSTVTDTIQTGQQEIEAPFDIATLFSGFTFTDKNNPDNKIHANDRALSHVGQIIDSRYIKEVFYYMQEIQKSIYDCSELGYMTTELIQKLLGLGPGSYFCNIKSKFIDPKKQSASQLSIKILEDGKVVDWKPIYKKLYTSSEKDEQLELARLKKIGKDRVKIYFEFLEVDSETMQIMRQNAQSIPGVSTNDEKGIDCKEPACKKIKIEHEQMESELNSYKQVLQNTQKERDMAQAELKNLREMNETLRCNMGILQGTISSLRECLAERSQISTELSSIKQIILQNIQQQFTQQIPIDTPLDK